jgi:hypothetical protein
MLDQHQPRGPAGFALAARLAVAACLLTPAISPPQAGAAQEERASAPPAFEVASIRQNTSGTQAPTTRVEGGRYMASTGESTGGTCSVSLG